MKSIVFFNNKGGVGKTTLACNIASFLSLQGHKVLIIDADPQCNATQSILKEEICEKIYLDSQNNKINTLYNVLEPLNAGEPSSNNRINVLPKSENAYQIDIIPGHPKLSLIEDILSEGWANLKGHGTRGFRITNWCHTLIQHLSPNYDFIVFDVGPSLGALNRSIILSCDYIVTPFGCDIFSLLGIKNIAQWIKQWEKTYNLAIDAFKTNDEDAITKYQIQDDISNKFRFAGYSIQQYVTKTFKEGPRPVKAYDRILSEIPDTVNNSMSFLSPNTLTPENYELGHIPYLYSLIPMAQSNRTPIHQLKSANGVVGSQFKQVKEYNELMTKITTQLLQNMK